MSPTIDPAVFELLGEIAHDPDSRLMKLSKGGLAHQGAREPLLSEREPLFTRAERHLLAGYREQVAFLLYKACQRAVMCLPRWLSLVYRTDNVVIPGREWWQSEMESLESTRSPEEARRCREMLSDAGMPRVSASSLGSASLAIVPRDETRIWKALALFGERKNDDGVRVLEDVLAHHPSFLNESFARQGLGPESLANGNAITAIAQYRRAFELAPERVGPVLGWLHAALVAGDKSALLESAQQLAEFRGSELADFVEDHLLLWKERVERGAFRPNSRTWQLSASFIDLPTPAARVASLFAEQPPERS